VPCGAGRTWASPFARLEDPRLLPNAETAQKKMACWLSGQPLKAKTRQPTCHFSSFARELPFGDDGLLSPALCRKKVCFPSMSIYATICEFGIKRYGEKRYFEIFIQGVPPHIDDVGPDWDFLPPPVDPNGSLYRCVFFVEAGDRKGTARSGQEFVNPLLKMTGQEYHDIRFVDLMSRLEQVHTTCSGYPQCRK
jgi:hypothetical protein